MLNDAHKLAIKFCETFPQKSGRYSDQDIANECGITKQAVNGWRQTGRIAKKHLPTLAKLSGKPLSYWIPSATNECTDLPQGISQTEIDLITAYRNADDRGRAALMWVAEQCLGKKPATLAEKVAAIDPDTLATSEQVREKANAGRTV